MAPDMGPGDQDHDDERRRMFGYFDAQGTWVPGILEAIRNLQNESKEIMKRLLENEQQMRVTYRWYIRGLVAIVLLRFLGWEHVGDMLKFFGVH